MRLLLAEDEKETIRLANLVILGADIEIKAARNQGYFLEGAK